MNTRPILRALVAAVAIVSMAACSSMNSSSSPGTSSSDRNRLTGEEMAATNYTTVYEAVQMLRPQWMNARGPISMTNSEEARPNVYMNGSHMGDLEYLRNVYVTRVQELRFWPPGEAGVRFGMGNPRGVIEIIPRS